MLTVQSYSHYRSEAASSCRRKEAAGVCTYLEQTVPAEFLDQVCHSKRCHGDSGNASGDSWRIILQQEVGNPISAEVTY